MAPSSDRSNFPTFAKIKELLLKRLVLLRTSLLSKPVGAELSLRSPAWVLTLLLVIVCLGSRLLFDGISPSLAGVVFIGLGFALSTIAAYWFCLATHWIRYLLLLTAALLLGVLFGFSNGPQNRFDWIIFLLPLAISIPVVVTIEITKIFFGKFERLNSNSTQTFQEGIQFSIRQLVILTTVVAIGFGLWNAFRDSILEQMINSDGGRIWRIVLVIAATIATYTLFSIWAVLGHFKYYRLFVCLWIGVAAIYAGSRYGPMPTFWFVMFLICWAGQVAMLLLLRLEGYRFVRHGTGSA